jgi:hypothetical protein
VDSSTDGEGFVRLEKGEDGRLALYLRFWSTAAAGLGRTRKVEYSREGTIKNLKKEREREKRQGDNNSTK